MTFGIGFASPSYAGIVTDRRLSGGTRSDEYSKCGVVEFRNGRFAYTFSGLAADGRGFETSKWLAETLCDCGAPDGSVRPSMERLRDLATKRFAALRVDGATKRLTVLLVGYIHSPLGFGLPAVYELSNFERLRDFYRDVALDEFMLSIDELEPNICCVKPIGSGNYGKLSFGQMGRLLTIAAPPVEVTRAAIDLIRQASDDPQTRATIGKRCSVVVLGRSAESGVFTDYAVDGTTNTYRSGSYVCANYGPRGAWLVTDPQFTGLDSGGTPIAVRTAKVSKAAPCPCGSGERFRDCHGAPGGYRAQGTKASFYYMSKQAPTETVTIFDVRGDRLGITGVGLLPIADEVISRRVPRNDP